MEREEIQKRLKKELDKNRYEQNVWNEKKYKRD